MASQRLNKLIVSAPDTTSVDLSRCNLYELSSHIPSLSNLRHVQTLNLAGNNLSTLPAELPSALPHLSSLDLSDIQFDDWDNTMTVLFELRSLKHLKVQLPDGASADELVQSLPNLLTVNGITVAPNPPGLEDVVALDLQDLKGLERLFAMFRTACSDEHSGPLLISPEESQVLERNFDEHVRNTVHALDTDIQKIEGELQQQLRIAEAKMQLYAFCMDEIVSAVGKAHPGLEDPTHQLFELLTALLRRLMRLSQAVHDTSRVPQKGTTQTDATTRSEVARLRSELNLQQNELMMAKELHRTEMEESSTMFEKEAAAHRKEVDLLSKKIQKAEEQTDELLSATEVLQNENSYLQRENQKNAYALQALREKGISVDTVLSEAEAMVASVAPQEYTSAFPSHVTTPQPKTSSLPNSTPNPTHPMQSQQPGTSMSVLSPNTPWHVPNGGETMGHTPQAGPISTQGMIDEVTGKVEAWVGGGGVDPSGTPAAGALVPNSARPSHASSHPSVQVAGNLERVLTHQQLLDIMKDIYASKERYDKKVSEGKAPPETMEQHLYSYLNHRYGLKPLIIEMAAAVLQAVRAYSDVDNDVSTFSFILRHDVDEGFRLVQKQLKDTVEELLRIHLKSRNALKTDTYIDALVKKKKESILTTDEWTSVVSYMYSEQDMECITRAVQDTLRKMEEEGVFPTLSHCGSQSSLGGGGNVAGSGPAPARRSRVDELKAKNKKPQLTYQQLLKILLDFQLKNHVSFLSGFVSLFRRVDADADGVVSEAEFRELVHLFDVGRGVTDPRSEPEFAALLDGVDPYNQQKITFSQCVGLLLNNFTPTPPTSANGKR